MIGEHELTLKYNVAGHAGDISVKREVTEDRARLQYPPDVNTFACYCIVVFVLTMVYPLLIPAELQ